MRKLPESTAPQVLTDPHSVAAAIQMVSTAHATGLQLIQAAQARGHLETILAKYIQPMDIGPPK